MMLMSKNPRNFGSNLTNLSSLLRSQSELIPAKHYLKETVSVSKQSQNIYQSLSVYEQDVEDYTVLLSYMMNINSNYIEWQSEINCQMRYILVSWMIEVHDRLSLQEQTLHHSITMLDRYGSSKNIKKNQYQLVGITCLFMASKYIELSIPKLRNYLQLCDGLYSSHDMVRMEGDIFSTLNFQLNCNALTYQLLFNRLATLVEEPQRITRLAEYMLNLLLVEYEFCCVNSNYLSALIIYISSKMKEVKGMSSKQMIRELGLSPVMFKEYFHKIVEVYNNRHHQKYEVINRKYKVVIRN